jgi:hypothetical protein
MTKTKWLEHKNTSILLIEEITGCIPEWQPLAQVTLRQIYPTIDPEWYVWLEWSSWAKKFPTKQEACAYALSQVPEPLGAGSEL